MPPSPKGAGSVVATSWFWFVFVTTSPIALVLGSLLWLVTAPFDPRRTWVHRFICAFSFNYLRVWPGWRVRVIGRERLPSGAAVLVANHQSMADIIAVMGLAYPFKFVSKASLFELPVVGWLMRMAAYVALERGHTGSTRKMIASCRRWLDRGVPVLLFPEGTYSGEPTMLPFRRGAFVLAKDAGVPVVPVALRGTRSLIEGDGPWLSSVAQVDIEVLEPVAPDAAADPERLAALVRARLEQAVQTPSGT